MSAKLNSVVLALCLTVTHAVAHGGSNVHDVRAYGAKGDGVTMDTRSIQNAIDAASASGGGRVSLSGGVFKSGTIYLKSHVELHIEIGAVLLGSDRLSDYNAVDAFPQNGSVNRVEGWRAHHLIVCLEQEDVAITGDGTIDGNGRAYFAKEPRCKGTVSWRRGGINCPDPQKALRPGQVIEFVESRNLRVRDIRIVDPTAWSCFFHGCEDVQVRGIRVDTDLRKMNTDGIDIDTCRNVTVSDCIFRTGDDAIAIRGATSRLKDKSRTCENIVINNCIAAVSATGCRIGVGTGVIRHVRISNFIVETAGTGIHVQSVYGTGNAGVKISDVAFSNCSLRDCAVAISVSGRNGKPPCGLSFNEVLIEENDIVDGAMIRVSESERPRLDGVRIVGRDGRTRDLEESDIGEVSSDSRFM